MKTEEINKKLEELLERNKATFDEFVNAVATVDLGNYPRTFKEAEVLDSLPPGFNQELLKGLGFKAFPVYGKMVIDCISNIATHEGRKDLMFKDKETKNHTLWELRVRKLRDGEIWTAFYDNLFGCAILTHDSRVHATRNA